MRYFGGKTKISKEISEYKHNLPEGAKIVLEIKSNQEIRGKEGRKETTEILFTFNNL